MRFARLGDRLADAGYTVLLVGAIMEEPLIVDVQGLAQSRLVGLAGMTTFPQTAALLGRCSGFVGNDSAPHHLAAAVGIPTVGLFFTTDPVRFGARGKHVRLLTARDPRSMEVDAVYDAVAELMAEAGRQ